MVYPDFPCDGQFSRAKPLIPTLLAIYSRYLGYDELGGWGWGRSQFFGFRSVGGGISTSTFLDQAKVKKYTTIRAGTSDYRFGGADLTNYASEPEVKCN